ncbi:MAG: DUF4338 domain-containing protein [Gammaproteobacteria bacterium]|nr:DUF4338 domain-containing protein [Gammaproteobacteria bacterium]
MELEVKYQGRLATKQDVEFINKLISENPGDSRWAISRKLCKAWNWVQPNGVLRDIVCRGFLLRLESAGYIKLPPRKCVPNNPLVNRKKPSPVEVDQTLINSSVSELQPLEIRQVRYTEDEKVFNGLIAHYHYLGYCHPVGEHLKYIIYTQDRPIACFAWSSAPRHIGCRDKYIGWSSEVRKNNIHLIAYNTRFLILPWIRSKCLASHLLGRITKVVKTDWERVYHHPVYFLETFVDKEKFKGISYQAANWIYLGDTTGRGKNDQTNKPNRSIKAVWGYPLSKNFRRILHNG